MSKPETTDPREIAARLTPDQRYALTALYPDGGTREFGPGSCRDAIVSMIPLGLAYRRDSNLMGGFGATPLGLAVRVVVEAANV